MQPSCEGSHRVKRQIRGLVKYHWKGHILEFKIAKDGWKHLPYCNELEQFHGNSLWNASGA